MEIIFKTNYEVLGLKVAYLGNVLYKSIFCW